MATIDTRTPRLNLPVPVVTNALKDDCPRLVEALTTLDGAVAGNTDNLREQWRRQLAEVGLTLVDGSFEEGATVSAATDAVWHIAGGQCYTWGGAFPKTVDQASTPASSGGISETAWVSVEVKFITAGNIRADSGLTVQQEIDKGKKVIFADFDSARTSTIKSEFITINYKYASVNYRKTNSFGLASTGDAHTFYDESGAEFKINEPKRQKNSAGIFGFSEIWTALNLDPTLFIKASELGIATMVVYTWTQPLVTYQHFLDLASIYGIDIVLQAVPNSDYTSDLNADFSKLSSLFGHKAVVGLYLFDEPNLTTYPLTRQGEIIAKARSLSNLPIYAATNAESNFESVPLHSDVDYIFTSNYGHFIGPVGVRRYASTTWASLEEEGLRGGRIIPLLTAYWYENEVATLNSAQIKSVNDFLAKNFQRIGMWAFYADKNGHFIENDAQIYDLVKSSLVLRNAPTSRAKMIRTFFRSNPLPANSYKYLTKPTSPADVPWLDPSSVSAWNVAAVLRIKSGESFTLNFGKPVKLEIIHFSLIDNNGAGNTAVIALTYNPLVNGGRQEIATKSITGGGDVEWVFTDGTNPPHLVKSISIKVLSSAGGDYLILERLGYVITE